MKYKKRFKTIFTQNIKKNWSKNTIYFFPTRISWFNHSVMCSIYWYRRAECDSKIYACLCTRRVPSAPEGRGHQIPRDWSCRWLWAAVWVLGLELRTSGRAARVISPEPCWGKEGAKDQIQAVTLIFCFKIKFPRRIKSTSHECQ